MFPVIKWIFYNGGATVVLGILTKNKIKRPHLVKLPKIIVIATKWYS